MNEQPQKECYSLRLHLYDRFGNGHAVKAYTKVKVIKRNGRLRVIFTRSPLLSHFIGNKC